jgi:hypothetical protein
MPNNCSTLRFPHQNAAWDGIVMTQVICTVSAMKMDRQFARVYDALRFAELHRFYFFCLRLSVTLNFFRRIFFLIRLDFQAGQDCRVVRFLRPDNGGP